MMDTVTQPQIHDETSQIPKDKILPSSTLRFPERLHLILSRDELSDAISWMPHGRSWKILSVRRFEEKVLSTYFPGIKYASFKRQVNVWGFTRIKEGYDENSYFHDMFLRGRPDLLKQIKRRSRNRSKAVNCGRGKKSTHQSFIQLPISGTTDPSVYFPTSSNSSVTSSLSSPPLSPVHVPSTRRVSVTGRNTEMSYCEDINFEDIFDDETDLEGLSLMIEPQPLTPCSQTREREREQYAQRKLCQTQKQSHLIHCSESIKAILHQGKSNLHSYLQLRGDKQPDIISRLLDQHKQLYSMLEMEQDKLQNQLLSMSH